MSASLVGYIGIVVALMLMALGVPIYLCLGITGFIGMTYILGVNAALANLAGLPYEWGSNWVLTTIPLFILMGNFAFHSGIIASLYEAAHKFLGHLPGGLGMATVAACAGFAAMSGSSLANAGAISKVALPEMGRYNYDRVLSASTVAAGGTIGVMIPPSTGFIVIGAITSLSIGRLFIAGLVPGLLMMLSFMTVIFVLVRRKPELAPPIAPFPWKERLACLHKVWTVALVFLLVMGGLYVGIFTPTEAGAVGAFSAFLVALFQRRLTRKVLTDSGVDTGRTTAMIFAILIGAAIFGNFLMLTGLPADIAQWVVSLPVPPRIIVALMLLTYIPLGCVMEMLAGIVITLPIYYPIVQALGFNGIWFAVLVELMGEIGLLTPPVGLNVFVITGATGLPVEKIFKGIVPFILADLVLVVIIFSFPQICLCLLPSG